MPLPSHLIAIFFHLGSYQLWDYFSPYIQRVMDSTSSPVDLYITYQKQDPILETIKQRYPNVILIESLLGCDCGGQLLMMYEAIMLGKNYDYVLKLHTKSRLEWRREMMEPICGMPSDIQRVYEIFETTPSVGMIGCQKWRLRMDGLNANLISGICKRLSLTYDRYNQYFLGGTIFWMRWKPMVDIITSKKIDLVSEYKTLEPGYIINTRPTVTHSWERLFGVLVYNADQILYGIDNNVREREQREEQYQARLVEERIRIETEAKKEEKKQERKE